MDCWYSSGSIFLGAPSSLGRGRSNTAMVSFESRLATASRSSSLSLPQSLRPSSTDSFSKTCSGLRRWRSNWAKSSGAPSLRRGASRFSNWAAWASSITLRVLSNFPIFFSRRALSIMPRTLNRFFIPGLHQKGRNERNYSIPAGNGCSKSHGGTDITAIG